ncbi:MAG: hypothetical protein A4E19_04510 [Nitrospira sp. SG-bin1]|nr:MAG: hypothetical protein A4E19_04510 [Nitrospira sp. SG-bin1]
MNGSGQASDQILGRNNIGGRPLDARFIEALRDETASSYQVYTGIATLSHRAGQIWCVPSARSCGGCLVGNRQTFSRLFKDQSPMAHGDILESQRLDVLMSLEAKE